MGKMQCTICNGYGSQSNHVLWDGIGGAEYRQCGFCNGTGKITQKQKMEHVRSFRKAGDDD